MVGDRDDGGLRRHLPEDGCRPGIAIVVMFVGIGFIAILTAAAALEALVSPPLEALGPRGENTVSTPRTWTAMSSSSRGRRSGGDRRHLPRALTVVDSALSVVAWSVFFGCPGDAAAMAGPQRQSGARFRTAIATRRPHDGRRLAASSSEGV